MLAGSVPVLLAVLGSCSSDGGDGKATTKVEAAKAVDSMTAEQKTKLMREVASVVIAARGVISANQSLINDASKGDKGLTADVVVRETKKGYLDRTNSELPQADDKTLRGEALGAIIGAVSSTMERAQPTINEKDVGFKGLLPAVFAKQVCDAFNRTMRNRMHVKLTAPHAYIRNRTNRPDEWEASVIEKRFKLPSWVKGTEVSEVAKLGTRSAHRMMVPEYYSASCLSCHGEPKGAIDVTGGRKEGAKLNELGGAVSVAIYQGAAAAAAPR